MVVVAQCLGLRVSEILALKWEDVNFENLSLFGPFRLDTPG